MHWKSKLGLLLGVVGIGLVVFSNYVQIQVQEGKVKISRAQRQVNQGKGLFSLTPMTKQFGNGIFGGAQQKINAGRQEVEQYEAFAGKLQLGGVALIVAGVVFFVLGRRRAQH